MSELTYKKLRDAVAGGAVALRSRTELQPADGPGGKVFPPTYAVNAEHKYAVETRQVGDREVQTVLLDSVASQANRAELALLEGWEVGDLVFPVPYVDFSTEDGEFGDIGRLTVLEAPHRLADAIFRDSLLDGTLFRLSEVGRAITNAEPKNATALFQYAPTALLFGQWDSTGPKGGLGSKFQRAFVSEMSVTMSRSVARWVADSIRFRSNVKRRWPMNMRTRISAGRWTRTRQLLRMASQRWPVAMDVPLKSTMATSLPALTLRQAE